LEQMIVNHRYGILFIFMCLIPNHLL